MLSALMTSSSLSGYFPLPRPSVRLNLSACCDAFSARTDLSPLSPTRTFNTSFFSLIAHIGFSDASWILGRILYHFSNNQTTTFACCWHCSFFHGSWGPIPGCFSVMGLCVPSLAVFLPSRPSGTCFIKPSTRLLADSFSCCLVLGFGSPVTRLCFSSWSAGCVLRRRLLMSLFFFHADSWFRLARVSRARLFLLA